MKKYCIYELIAMTTLVVNATSSTYGMATATGSTVNYQLAYINGGFETEEIAEQYLESYKKGVWANSGRQFTILPVY